MHSIISNPGLFDTPAEPTPALAGSAYRLWYRRSRRHPWEVRHTADTESEAWDAMCDDPTRLGHWTVCPADRRP